MINQANNEYTKRLNKLKKNLESKCKRKSINEIGWFVIPSDKPFAITYKYRTPIGELAPLFSHKGANKRYYSGFVKGSVIRWEAVSTIEIVKILKRYGYTFEDFLKGLVEDNIL